MSFALEANEIHLLNKNIYLRNGFKKEWTKTKNFSSPWMKLKANQERKKILIVDQKLPGNPQRSFLSLYTTKPQNFTLAIPFENNSIYTSPGLYIHRLGNNWEVYLNGHLIKREVYLNEKGFIKKKRNLRHIHILFNKDYLKQGKNIFVFRLIGDPTNQETGISLYPVFIDENETIMKYASEKITLMLIFVYLVIGVYHIFLYLNNRKENFNLFFGLASIEFFLYIFFRTHAVYSIIPYSDWVIKGELIILYTIIPTFGAFAGLIIKKRIEAMTLIYGAFSLLLILVTLPASEAFQEDILKIWQVSAIIPTFYFLIYTIGYSYIEQINRFIEKGHKLFKSIFIALGNSVAGNLLLGMIVVVFCMFFDILDANFFHLGLSISRYGFFLILVGIAIVLSNRFLYIHKIVEKLNFNLEENIADLNLANQKISLSEEKYRVLVEGASEVIFVLDEKFCFKTVNRALRTKLGLSPEDVYGITFLDFVKRSSDGISVEFQYINEKLAELKEKGEPVFFKIDYTMPSTLDVIDLKVRLEYINIEGSNEILGKISRVAEDSLLKFFKKEKVSFSIGNQLTTAEEVTHRITRNLQKYMDQKDVNLLRIAIREMVINAIEHGNFEISFEDKTEALIHDNYFKIIAMKQKDENYKNKTVDIEYRITPTKAEFSIIDQGNGFDYEKVLSRIDDTNTEMLSHGRGIIMAVNVFDEVKFNKKGNQVLLVKNF